MIDVLNLTDPYISTNNRSFYKCPADKAVPAWNFAIAPDFGLATNQLPFPCSYVYYRTFYVDDNEGGLAQRKMTEVLNPTSYNGTDPDYNFDWTLNGLRGADLK
jgi:hypothetical protein